MNKVAGLGFGGPLDARGLDVVVAGFESPDTQGVPSHEQYPREAAETAIGVRPA